MKKFPGANIRSEQIQRLLGNITLTTLHQFNPKLSRSDCGTSPWYFGSSILGSLQRSGELKNKFLSFFGASCNLSKIYRLAFPLLNQKQPLLLLDKKL